MVKKVRKIFGSLSEKTLSLHPLRQRNSSENETKQVLKNFEKVPKSFGDSKKELTFAAALKSKKTIRRRSRKVLKKVGKIFKKDLVVRKKVFTFAAALKSKNDSRKKRKGSENFLKKSFEKIWWFEKVDLTLHHFPAKKMAAEPRRRSKDPTRQKERNCSYSNIVNSVL